jgi:thioredoxin 1
MKFMRFVSLSDEELRKIKEEKMRKIIMTQKKSDSTSEGVIHLNRENFREVVNDQRPVLVDFWAEWCMPCRMMTPIMDSMAKKHGGNVVFAKVNVDENPDIAAEFGVNAIPNFMVFLKGKVVGQALGAIGEQGLEDLVKKVM